VVTNASLGGFAGSGATHSTTITPEGNGDVGVSITDALAADLAGNPNLASSAAVTLTATTEAAELLQKEAVARSDATAGMTFLEKPFCKCTIR
jgi:hypothetical protein